MPQQVREVMTPGPVRVAPDALVVDVARLMRSEKIGVVLVVEDGQLCGLVTDRDLVVRILADGGPVTDRPVREACSEHLLTVAPEDTVEGAVALMRGAAVRRLPVVADGEPVGMVSLGDLALERDPDSALSRISGADPNE
ncbi:CBS domain-containing protein [Streptomyces reniochalinae]|uniref:CBS domain-containing protein n=1 Tax=Streptomyces reniochalinae TaxID=2250578 RepID=A0A367E743_9ACTN|nr:CBS domain-containing protein [Streptomyces reniochalinae]RCG13821.1 CBS domain-containing protein [Streptomyces reniochalinae]